MDIDLAGLPHEDWCDLGSTHRHCCVGRAIYGCSCLTRDVVRALGFDVVRTGDELDKWRVRRAGSHDHYFRVAGCEECETS